MCINDAETPIYRLLYCSVASHIWNFFGAEFKLICTWPCPLSMSRKNLVIKVLPVAILWSQWKERNDRAFNKLLAIAKIIQNIKHIITFRQYLKHEFQNSSLKGFMIIWMKVVFEPLFTDQKMKKVLRGTCYWNSRLRTSHVHSNFQNVQSIVNTVIEVFILQTDIDKK